MHQAAFSAAQSAEDANRYSTSGPCGRYGRYGRYGQCVPPSSSSSSWKLPCADAIPVRFSYRPSGTDEDSNRSDGNQGDQMGAYSSVDAMPNGSQPYRDQQGIVAIPPPPPPEANVMRASHKGSKYADIVRYTKNNALAIVIAVLGVMILLLLVALWLHRVVRRGSQRSQYGGRHRCCPTKRWCGALGHCIDKNAPCVPSIPAPKPEPPANGCPPKPPSDGVGPSKPTPAGESGESGRGTRCRSTCGTTTAFDQQAAQTGSMETTLYYESGRTSSQQPSPCELAKASSTTTSSVDRGKRRSGNDESTAVLDAGPTGVAQGILLHRPMPSPQPLPLPQYEIQAQGVSMQWRGGSVDPSSNDGRADSPPHDGRADSPPPIMRALRSPAMDERQTDDNARNGASADDGYAFESLVALMAECMRHGGGSPDAGLHGRHRMIMDDREYIVEPRMGSVKFVDAYGIVWTRGGGFRWWLIGIPGGPLPADDCMGPDCVTLWSEWSDEVWIRTPNGHIWHMCRTDDQPQWRLVSLTPSSPSSCDRSSPPPPPPPPGPYSLMTRDDVEADIQCGRQMAMEAVRATWRM